MLSKKDYSENISIYKSVIKDTFLSKRLGQIKAIHGTNIVADIPNAKLGEICTLSSDKSQADIYGEIISIEGNTAKLCISGETTGIAINSPITATGYPRSIEISDAWLGRVVNGNGQFIDHIDSDKKNFDTTIVNNKIMPLKGHSVDPLNRSIINKPLPTGVRSIDSILTLGLGQRIGIFGQPGAGKSVLLGMIARGCSADVIVVGLIGERGREVREFLENELPVAARSRCVTVVSTSDNSPLERIWGAKLSITVAEYFRDQGKNVLLMMDSLTRFARARREVALQAGELPVRQGYPPSVFDELPKLLERAGQNKRGSITGIYTVLHDGDRQNDIISEEIKSLIDGHIQLSNELAASSHYPAIDVLTSKSRIMKQVTTKEHQKSASKALQLLEKYKDIQLLVQVGEYKKGADTIADIAIEKHADINHFLTQGIDEKSNYAEAIHTLEKIVS